MVEIRDRKVGVYVNDLAGYTKKVPEAVFSFTLEEIQALEAWVPRNDGFYREVTEAMEELEKRRQPHDQATMA